MRLPQAWALVHGDNSAFPREPWQHLAEGHQGRRQKGDALGTRGWQLSPALGTELGADLALTRRRWDRAGGAVQDKVQVCHLGSRWTAAGFPRGGGAGSGRGGLGHSLRHVALHADQLRLHKPELARGHVPAQKPGQAGHLGPEDLDGVAGSEGHLFGPGALVVHRR